MISMTSMKDWMPIWNSLDSQKNTNTTASEWVEAYQVFMGLEDEYQPYIEFIDYI